MTRFNEDEAGVESGPVTASRKETPVATLDASSVASRDEAQALRDFADFLDAHPAARAPERIYVPDYQPNPTAAYQRVSRLGGDWKARRDDEYMHLERTFGPVVYSVFYPALALLAVA